MKITYLFSALVFFVSCRTGTTQPKEQLKQEVTDAAHGEPFAVHLGNDLVGRGMEGTYVVYSDSTEQHGKSTTLDTPGNTMITQTQ